MEEIITWGGLIAAIGFLILITTRVVVPWFSNINAESKETAIFRTRMEDRVSALEKSYDRFEANREKSEQRWEKLLGDISDIKGVLKTTVKNTELTEVEKRLTERIHDLEIKVCSNNNDNKGE